MRIYLISKPLLQSAVFMAFGWFYACNAHAIIYSYDNLGRLVSADYGAYGKLTYSYDEAGNILSATTVTSNQVDTDNDGIPNQQDPDDDNDGIPDTWELAYELDPLNAADGALDKDNDGVSNLAEYQAGRNPGLNEAAAVVPVITALPQQGYVAPLRKQGDILLKVLPSVTQPQ